MVCDDDVSFLLWHCLCSVFIKKGGACLGSQHAVHWGKVTEQGNFAEKRVSVRARTWFVSVLSYFFS